MTGPTYDPRSALPPGQVMNRAAEASLVAAFDGTNPVTASQAIAVCGPSPAYPTTLPRFIDSNPDPRGFALDGPGGIDAAYDGTDGA